MLEFKINNKAGYKIKNSWDELSQEEFILVCKLLKEYNNGSFSLDSLKMRIAGILLNKYPIGKLSFIMDNVKEISESIKFFYDKAPELDRVIIKDLPFGLRSYYFYEIDGNIYTDLTFGQYQNVQDLIHFSYIKEDIQIDTICSILLNSNLGPVRSLIHEYKEAIIMNFLGIDSLIRLKYNILYNCVNNEVPRILTPITGTNFNINLVKYLDDLILEKLN